MKKGKQTNKINNNKLKEEKNSVTRFSLRRYVVTRFTNNLQFVMFY